MAEWTTAAINDLGDACFLYIAPGGSKDADGKTSPRSLRHFPYRGADGKIDLPHLRDAIGRIPQSDLPAEKKTELQAHAEKLLESENKDSRDDRQAAQREFRVDLVSGSVGERRRTGQGGVVARANLTRVGVFKYTTPDGGSRRELRHPDEVFAPKSLATYGGATLTVDHPGRVHPGNWKTHTIGHVGPDVQQNGNFVSGEVHIQDADAIDRAERGELQEISCGYTCDFEPIPCEWMGQKADGQQRNIAINHVGIGPKGWGRMGPETRMHLDARECVSVQDETASESEAREDATPHVVVHGAEGKVTPHPSKSAAASHAKELSAEGVDAEAMPEKAYKATKDPAYKLTRGGASEVASAASDAAKKTGTAAAHIQAANAHHEAAAAHHAVGAHTAAAEHEGAARAHEASAVTAPDFDAAKYPRREGGRFDSEVRAESSLPSRREDGQSQTGEPMTPEEKAALEKAEKAAKDATEAATKAREDAASAKTEAEKAAAQTREDKATIAKLTAERDLLKLHEDTAKRESESTEAIQKQDAAAEKRMEELFNLRADARLVFASAEDPEGKKWKSDGKKADEIRREILTSLEPNLKLDGIDGITSGVAPEHLPAAQKAQSQALCGIYESAMGRKRTTDKARADAEEAAGGRRQDGTAPGDDEDDDGEPPPDANKARKEFLKRVKGASKKNADRKPGKR